jgi:hypothetical protein
VHLLLFLFQPTIRLLAYADDIDIIARSQAALEAFISLERAAGEMGLKINEENTKYLTTRVHKNKINRSTVKVEILI